MQLLLALFSLVCFVSSQYIFDDFVGLGRQFDGIGGLSGGGATSKLLPGYPQVLRDQILDYLFKPNFGAAVQILKVEIGGGSMSGIGSEATHIYYDGDENYQRGYEWWIMQEAKKRNPNIKLYGLPWVFSGWVSNGTNSPYTSPDRTVEYILKWISGAKEVYGLTIDYIGEWNEQNYDINYLKMLRAALDKNGFENVRIVAPDDYQAEFETNLARDMLLDPQLSSAVDVFGVHYSSTLSNMGSLMWGKQLWASEDYSTLNDNQGARCWARSNLSEAVTYGKDQTCLKPSAMGRTKADHLKQILNQNYVNGLMSSTISWNLIAAYYEGMPYQRCGLMTANSPWSGHYDVNPTIWITGMPIQHSSQNLVGCISSHRAGVGHLVGGGSYVALTSPHRDQLTIIVETNNYGDSLCLHESLPYYTIVKQNISFSLQGSFSRITQLNVWFSQIGNAQQQNVVVLFNNTGVLTAVNGTFSFVADLNQVYTLTTLTTGSKGQFADPPPATAFPLPYFDSFNAVTDHQEPYFVAPMSGSFEVLPTFNATNKVLRQMTVLNPVDWCETENFTLALFGNITWTNIYVETSFSLDVPYAADGVFIAQRINSGGCYTAGGQGFLFYVYPKKGTYEVWADSRRANLLGYGPADNLNLNGFNKLGMKVKGAFGEGYINDKLVFGLRMPSQPASGFAAIGTSGFGHADFDYILVTNS